MIRYFVPPAMIVALYMALIYAPTEATMGDLQRIFYFHVPSAWGRLSRLRHRLHSQHPVAANSKQRWDAIAVSAAGSGHPVYYASPSDRLHVGQAYLGYLVGLGPTADHHTNALAYLRFPI